jgi:hypothetical protein
MAMDGSIDICERCGATIQLVKTGVNSYKWVTDFSRPLNSWKCRPTADFPVRGHRPILGQEPQAS